MTEPTYTWSINALDRYTSDGQVLIAHYSLNATTDDGTASLQASIGFAEPTQEEFIPFDQLTEETVVGWVQQQLGEEQIAGLQAGLLQTIIERNNPPLASGLPWVQPETESDTLQSDTGE